VIDPRAPLSQRELLGVSRTHYRTFRRKGFLFYADAAADSGYLIRSGHVRCFLLDADGRETTTALLGPGQFVGTAALLNRQQHREFCEALTPVEAWSLPADELCRARVGSPLVQGWLLGCLGRRLELALALRRAIALLSAQEGAADLRLRLLTLSGVDPGAVRQTSLAKLLQIRPETLARSRRSREQRQRARRVSGERIGQGRREFATERQVVRGYLPEGCIGQVLAGDVELSLTADGSRAVVVETLEPGDLFGFSSLLGLPPLAYSLAGAAPGAIAVITHEQFLRSLALSPAASAKMVIRLTDRLLSLEQQLARAAVPDVRDRLTRVLREAAGGDGTPYVPAGLSHDVLARRLGVCRETVTRGLATLVEAGVITRYGRRIVMVSEERQRVKQRNAPNAPNATLVWLPNTQIGGPTAMRNSRQRQQQLSTLERLQTIERLGGSGLGVREISRRTGFNPSTISRWLRIGRRPDLRQALQDNRIDVARAVVLLDAPEPVATRLIEGAMAVSTAELRRQVAAIKCGAMQAVQEDHRHMTDALRHLRAVRSNVGKPLLVASLRRALVLPAPNL